MLLKIIAETIQEKKGISPEALRDLVRVSPDSDKSLFQQIARKGIMEEEELLSALAVKLGIPYARDLEAEGLDSSLVSKVPIAFAKKHKLVPLKMEDGVLTIAALDPLNYEPLDDIRVILGCREIRVVISGEKQILETIHFLYEQSTDGPEEMIQAMDAETSDRFLQALEETEDLLEANAEAPVIRLVNLILFQAVKERASDIHIEPFQKDLLVRYRIDGILYPRFTPPKRYQSAIVSRVKIMAKLDIAEKRLPQDGRLPIKVADKDIDIRVSIIPTTFGERVVLRLLDKTSVLLGLEEIGLYPDQLKSLEEMIHRPHGMLLVTGPTGSGKTTTLYAALNRINSPDKNIITIEDPVEYQLRGIGQIQVTPKIGLTFARGLRSVLRHDPDVILVGEIRDPETAEIAIQSALTGHLVFSTLHTNDAASAITRLVDMGIEPFLIASVLRAIVAQRLIRVICPQCKEPSVPARDSSEKMGLTPADSEGKTTYRGKGCPSCSMTGYRGRTGIYEMLVVSEDIRALILKKADAKTLAMRAIQEGMKTLREDGLRRVLAGATTLEEVARVTQD